VSDARDVCAVADIPGTGVLGVVVGKRRLGVARVGDRVFVFSAVCPHRGGPLDKGRVRPFVNSPCPGEIEVDATRPLITCPWHNWEYDLTSGAALFDRKRKIPVFRCEVRDGRVFAHL
jgi:nitrite reductase/ring-hydroxylating ferredoxin subunit